MNTDKITEKNEQRQEAKLTPRQKEVIERLKAHKVSRIRHAVNYGRLETYFWNVPFLDRTIDLRVFDSLRHKGLIEPDGSPNYWRLSSLGANS